MTYKFNPLTQTFIEVKEASRFQRLWHKRLTRWQIFLIGLVQLAIIITVAYFSIRSSMLVFEKNQRDHGVKYESPYPHFN